MIHDMNVLGHERMLSFNINSHILNYKSGINMIDECLEAKICSQMLHT